MNTTTSIRAGKKMTPCALLAVTAPAPATPKDGKLVSRCVTGNYADLT